MCLIKRSTTWLGFLMLFAGTVATAQPSLYERRGKIGAMETKPSPQALERKARSEAVLRSEGVPINQHLPVIESEQEVKRRTVEEIAHRALALLVVAVRGQGLDQATVDGIVKDYGLTAHFTPKERAFLKNASPSQHDRVQFTWRYEAAWTLLWALGYIEKLERPTSICDVRRAVTLMKARTTNQFIRDAKLRPLSQILDEADRIYRYHWAVTDARINQRPAPAGLEPGVTLERHYSLNWLIGYMDEAWDDISTDT